MSISMDVGLETRNIPMEALDDVLADFGMFGDVLIYVLFCLGDDDRDTERQASQPLRGFSDMWKEDVMILLPALHDAEETVEERAGIKWLPPTRIADAARRLALAFEKREPGAVALWDLARSERKFGDTLARLAYRIESPDGSELEGITPGDPFSHLSWHLRKMADFCDVLEEEQEMEVRVCWHE